MKKTSLFVLFIYLLMASSLSFAFSSEALKSAEIRLLEIRDGGHSISEQELEKLLTAIIDENSTHRRKIREIEKVIDLAHRFFDRKRYVNKVLNVPPSIKSALEILKAKALEQKEEEKIRKISELEKQDAMLRKLLDDALSVAVELSGLLNHRTKKYKELHEKVDEFRAKSDISFNFCNFVGLKSQSEEVSRIKNKFCIKMAYLIKDQLVKISSHVAEYLFKSKQFSLSKKLYRDIIIHHTEPRYRSYVKKAEFALEDIKEINGQ